MSMRAFLLTLCVCNGYVIALAHAVPTVSQTVYVQSTVDTDKDGKPDKIYAVITRPEGATNLPTIFKISPYALGGNDTQNHNVDVTLLPQDVRTDDKASSLHKTILRNKAVAQISEDATARGYADVTAHSVGTGNSEGCPTVGDEAEALAAKSVIDWLNGRAKAFDANGREVTAGWASGSVGMIGLSYDGTLPNMVATTGVEGLKAIIPASAISSWYNYYRANGLVVGPGGYIGEDADVLGKFIVRSGACAAEMLALTREMGRENGDFTEFWQQRDYISKASQVRAAVFIMHGQSDWNVRQRHAIEWWKALEGVVPRRMWLHKGVHSYPDRADLQEQIWAWFDQYVKSEPAAATSATAVEVESPNGLWTKQNEWPSELTHRHVFYLNDAHVLSESSTSPATASFVDAGKRLQIQAMMDKPTQDHPGRLAFISDRLAADRLLSGTPKVHLSIAVQNRKAANITVAVIDYDPSGRGSIVTRGWVDPQNYSAIEQGEPLVPGREYQLSFDLEPKQFTFRAGHQVGILVTATDYDYTLRPDPGTKVAVSLGDKSFVELMLSGD